MTEAYVKVTLAHEAWKIRTSVVREGDNRNSTALHGWYPLDVNMNRAEIFFRLP